MNHWHALEAGEAAARLGVKTAEGLSSSEVAARRVRYGANGLVDRGGRKPWRILWEQLTATMVLVLIAAAAVSAVLKDFKDAGAILAIVVLNTVLGFSQEFKAEKAMAALKRMVVPVVKVLREGRVLEIPSSDLVPGDVVLLEAGNLVPADGRLLEIAGLRLQEAALTGESAPVEKKVDPVRGEGLPLGDRTSMAYMGTAVSTGRGRMLVTETGMATELGKIASMIQSTGRESTPLQKRLDRLAKQLAALALGIVGVVFVLGLLRGEDARLMFLTAVSMAVAAVPEGLPAVVTIALALGAQRMLKRRSLIRKLPAVETLGSVTVICSDKTGTLTQNRMTVTALDVAGHRLVLDDRAWTVVGDGLSGHPSLAVLLAGAALCNDAELDAQARPVGDPTETALLSAAREGGIDFDLLRRGLPRVAELPFDSERKRMTTVHQVLAPGFPGLAKVLGGGPFIAFTKGAVDGLLEISTAVWTGQKVEPMDDAWRGRIAAANAGLAEKGMRVLGLAFRPWDGAWAEVNGRNPEKDMVFVGLTGMEDPPRPEVKAAVEVCRAAGIRTVMITGDHPLTALHVARRLGMAGDGRIMTGRDLELLSVEELAARVEEVSVFARVSPEHKLKIVAALQSRGHTVAMTGDGVNDAPALKKADIGVAMGVTGTDVSQQAADMVLLDDNFTTIVAAVEEGRAIYHNIRKFIKYLLTTNFAEILVMLAAPFLGMPLPLTPLQILWINLVTDGPTALTLSVEPAEKDAMRRPPDQRENILGGGLGWHVLWVGCLMTVAVLLPGYVLWRVGHPAWRTMVFTSLAFAQMAHVLAIRSEKEPLWRLGLFSNPWLLGAVIGTVGLQFCLIYIPGLREVFGTVPLTPGEILTAMGSAGVIFIGVETEKWLKRRAGRKT